MFHNGHSFRINISHGMDHYLSEKKDYEQLWKEMSRLNNVKGNIQASGAVQLNVLEIDRNIGEKKKGKNKEYNKNAWL